MTLVRALPFAHLMPRYLLNCRKNILAMRDALDRADFETVRSLGHQMSGTGAMYGLQFISDTGAAIEQAAEKSNIDASRDRVGELSTYLDGIDAIYGGAGTLCSRRVNQYELAPHDSPFPPKASCIDDLSIPTLGTFFADRK
jgi:HPt (histidine-containing phosphotransfer) domain-containing protein